MIPVTVHGAEGRMGKLVTALVAAAADTELVALITETQRACATVSGSEGLPLTGQDRLDEVHPLGGVIVDFSLAGALTGLLEQGARCQAPLVIGTTGYNNEQQLALAAYAERFPVVHAPNFSIGIPALQILLRTLARTLPADFSAEQVETHHRHKLDRPSGTARWLAESWESARDTEVPTHSLRLGEIVGEHSWLISDDEESLQLTHRAHSRQAFLRGVLPAVRFVHGRQAGLYGLPDVLAALAEEQ